MNAVDLTVKERIVLSSLLPSQGALLTLQVTKRAQEELTFSPAEIDSWKIRQEGTQLFWDQPAADATGPVSLALEDAAVDLIKAELQRLDGAKQLTMDQLSLYEKFIGATHADAPAGC